MIEYCVERLYHFSCNSCKNWFTIGDWKVKKVMHCPHCGVMNAVSEKK